MRLWRRITAVIAVVGFVTGAFGQAIPNVVSSRPCAMMMMSVSQSMAGDDGVADHDQSSGKTAPICIDAGGCVVSASLPAVVGPDWIPVHWTPIAYWQSSPTLSGRTVGPELDPPILA
jgi:hypothetical protein